MRTFLGGRTRSTLLGKQLPHVGVAADFACLKPGRFAQYSDLPPDTIFSVHMKQRFDFESCQSNLQSGSCQRIRPASCTHPRSAMIASSVSCPAFASLGLPRSFPYGNAIRLVRSSQPPYDFVERWSFAIAQRSSPFPVRFAGNCSLVKSRDIVSYAFPTVFHRLTQSIRLFDNVISLDVGDCCSVSRRERG